jgi:antitoxin HicB
MKSSNNKDRKPLNFYLKLDYPITFYPEEVGGFTVMIKDLPGCMSQGETLEEAYEMITEAKELWLESAHEFGDPIPLPHTLETYSGKTMLRMPKYLHKKLAEAAKREDSSLNQYIVSLLSDRNATKQVEALQQQIDDIRQQLSPAQSPAQKPNYAVAETPTAQYNES